MLTAAPVATASLGTCRVLAQAEHAAQLAQNLGAALRQLHTFTHDCENCVLRDTCLAQGWNSSLDAAIRDIAEEWGLC